MDGTGTLLGNSLNGGAGGETSEAGKKEDKKGNSQNGFWGTYDAMNARTGMFTSNKVRNVDASNVREQLNEIRQQCINYLIDLLFPERRRNRFMSETGNSQSSQGFEESMTNQGSENSDGFVSDRLTSGNGIPVTFVNMKTFTFSNQYYHAETETTGFSTQGTVKCADGREINFNLNLEMSRTFEEYYEETVGVRQVSMCDPLVINLDGNIADLSDQTFLFDLDGD